MAWARLSGYKPTVENLLAYEEKGWRVLPVPRQVAHSSQSHDAPTVNFRWPEAEPNAQDGAPRSSPLLSAGSELPLEQQ